MLFYTSNVCCAAGATVPEFTFGIIASLPSFFNRSLAEVQNLRKADSLTKVVIEGTLNGVVHHEIA
jgi:hypothetical protein